MTIPETLKRQRWPLVFFLLVSVMLALCFAVIGADGLYVDEHNHYRQIRVLSNMPLDPFLAMLPGYHLLMAGLLNLFGNHSVFFARGLTAGLGMLSIGVFFLCARTLASDPHKTVLLAAQYAFFPILFPFFFLIYTDVPSLLLVLLMVWATLRRDYRFAGLLGCLSLLFRQNNVIWMLFCLLLILSQSHGFNVRRYRLKALLEDVWVFALGLALLAVFVAQNNGFSLGGKQWHPRGLHFGNIYMLLFYAFFLFLPMHIAHLKTTWNFIKPRLKFVLPLLMAGFAFYFLTFKNSHHFNQAAYDYAIRNKILLWAATNDLHKTLFFLPVAASVLLFCGIPLRQKIFYWLYPLTALVLLPAALIEQRYYLMPMVLFMLLRKDLSPAVSYATLAIYVVLSIGLLYGIHTRHFFM